MNIKGCSAKNHKCLRRKRQSITAKQEKSQTPKFISANLTFMMIGLSFGDYKLWRLRLLRSNGLALVALALAVFGAIECILNKETQNKTRF